jgi:hypothetical protein
MQVSFGADSALPRDRFVITPHFNDAGATTDPQGLADDLADGIAGIITQTPIPTREIVVKAYDAQGTKPVYPQGTAVRNANAYPASGIPRELALCLSFYSERNVPRSRGRLYIPLALIIGTSVSGSRPREQDRTALGLFPPVFTGLGGADVDWCVYSRSDNVARPVTHWYVDDEFDIQRRRGLRATTRTLGTTQEAGLPG